MANSSRLYRNFIILQEDERGYTNDSDKTLSGYSKIEAKGDNCKISFYAQNLRKDNDKYHMMLICAKKDTKQIIDLGVLNITDSGKCDEVKEYNTYNIGGVEIPFERVSGAAIGKYKDGIPIFIMCGFLNGEEPGDNWKNYKVIKCNEQVEKPVEKKTVKREEKKEEKKYEEKKEEKKYEEKKNNKKDENKKEEIVDQSEDRNNTVSEEHIYAEKENKTKDKNKDVHAEEKVVVEPHTGENLRGKFEDYEEKVEDMKEFNPGKCNIKGPVGEYFEGIAEGFEPYSEGFKEIKYCKWYKVKISSLYEMCNMSNYNKYTLAYYPMLNYYPYIKKYGYFMLGYKCDNKGYLKYIVYAIPGKKDKDEQPYDGKTGFVTWCNAGAKDNLGCWLMFYDYKNSTVVVPMQ